MRLSPSTSARLSGRYRALKSPRESGPAAQYDPAVKEVVSEMLSAIESEGIDAVRRYAAELDSWTEPEFELEAGELAEAGHRLPRELREAIELGSERTRAFAKVHRDNLADFDVELVPGLHTGMRLVPISRVGSYLPAGRFPLTASAFMTVGVAKEAGVATVIACTPPQPNGRANDAVVYAAAVSGVDRLFVLGGVQALAAMAFGLLDDEGAPVDLLIGAGNAYVAEAKRQLYGRVAIDLPAGPSEIAVLADETADPAWVAADLLGQAEHGVNSPAALVTTSEAFGRAVASEIAAQIPLLSTREIAGPAWRDHGSILIADSPATAITLMDDLAPEHLEIMTDDDDAYHSALTNYGSIFLGPWSTVAYSDKGMAGTNHVLPTAGGARHSAGLSVSRFLKPLTFQRVEPRATASVATAVAVISDSEGMDAHRRTAAIRLAAAL